MCGRMTQTRPVRDYALLFDATPVPGLSFAPRYNLAPSQKALAIRLDLPSGRRELWAPTWGLVPHWARERGTIAPINARIETVGTRPMFREAFRRRRCLVPADGYFEWQALSGGKTPWYFRRASGEPLALAGLWDSWRSPATGEILETFAVLVRPASREVRFVHDRMPVLLGREEEKDWLDPSRIPGEAFLARLSDREPKDLVAYEVGRGVNSPRNEGPALILPWGPGPP